MRTIRVELQVPMPVPGVVTLFGGGASCTISTEVVLTDESEEGVRQAGVEAREVLTAFMNGYGEDQ